MKGKVLRQGKIVSQTESKSVFFLALERKNLSLRKEKNNIIFGCTLGQTNMLENTKLNVGCNKCYLGLVWSWLGWS